MQPTRWIWTREDQLGLALLLESPPADHWIDALEEVLTDAVTTKVVVVCAALGVARGATQHEGGGNLADRDFIGYLEEWIHTPTDELFERIYAELFGPDGCQSHRPSVSDVVFWALRTATCSVDGCGELAWALSAACSAAEAVGLQESRIRDSALGEIRGRMYNALGT